MHKSGKHWVTTVMSQIGFIRFMKRGTTSPLRVKDVTSMTDRHSAMIGLLRGAVAAGAVVGAGALVEHEVYADEDVATQSLEVSSTT
ncbi:KxYKxGKxW signal peptide domain-containing protein, partial [Streptococcus saliviloxodontae]